ncbi:MAG: methylenetetrahydrofolate reductase [Clostridia bacterium]|nr:methylenetetrahydrofolate reductase [NAD(P)H] [Clostridia bacterium]
MYISEIFKEKPNTLSFEVFPPKKSDDLEKIMSTVTELAHNPVDYMSVTYGAGGTTASYTTDIADHMQNTLGITALSHLTCVNASKDSVNKVLLSLREKGIENILALRGDLPSGVNLENLEFSHASDLATEIKKFGGFCVGGACYPECHPDAASLDADIENLKIKIDSGVDFLVTQMFFDNDRFYDFRDRAAKKGINVPIDAGIMPLTNINQIKKMCILSGGASMPQKFTRMIAKYADNPLALKQAGIAYAVDQIIDLLSNDTAGVHIYTMNKPDIAQKITNVINDLF